MHIQIELITPRGKFLSKRERVSEAEYEESLKGLKQAVQGEIDNFSMPLADGGPDDDILIAGKDVLTHSVFRVIVEK